MDISLLQVITLMVIGVVAGIINTLAGGGSNLSVPALMIFGLPPDIANATNRVSIMLQGIIGAKKFHDSKKLPTDNVKHMLLPTFLGALVGSLAASYAPPAFLRYALLFAMSVVSLLILLRPNVIAPPAGTVPHRYQDTPSAFWWLLLAGFYGGFVQAGVGFILITVFAGVLRYDLVSSNALKMLMTLFFTAIALVIFIFNQQVRWLPGIILALGSMVGAYIGVKMALKASQQSLKWFLFIMTLAASAAALYKT